MLRITGYSDKYSAFPGEKVKFYVNAEKKENYESKFCIFATGCLSVPNKPDIEGLDKFEGQLLSTSYWPREEVDLSGKNVAIIGTGSSSIQTIPEIAKDVKNLYVFQRTPNYSIPSNNGPMDKEIEADITIFALSPHLSYQ